MAWAFFISSCAHFPEDPSLSAEKGHDESLIQRACEGTPSKGFDVCYLREGAVISESWVLVLPRGDQIQGGELDVYYRDLHRSYPILPSQNQVELPWREVLGRTEWARDTDGEALALLSLRYQDSAGLPQLVRYRAIAKLMVLAPGYDRLPLGSPYAAWKGTCKVEYSTAGRSAIECSK